MSVNVSLVKLQNGETRIKYRCSLCDQKISVSNRHAGKEMKCPTCGNVNSVPDPRLGSGLFKSLFG